jgi:hypothetical protein
MECRCKKEETPSVVIISFVSIGLSVLFSHLSFLLLSSSVVLEILMA